MSRYKVIGRIVYHLQFLNDNALEAVLEDLKAQLSDEFSPSRIQFETSESDSESSLVSLNSAEDSLEAEEDSSSDSLWPDEDTEESVNDFLDDSSDEATNFGDEPKPKPKPDTEAQILAEAERVLLEALSEKTAHAELFENAFNPNAAAEDTLFEEDDVSNNEESFFEEDDSDEEDTLFETDEPVESETVFQNDSDSIRLDTEYLEADELFFSEEDDFETNFTESPIETLGFNEEAMQLNAEAERAKDSQINSLLDYDTSNLNIKVLEEHNATLEKGEVEKPLVEIKSLNDLDELHLEISDLDDDLFFDLTSDA